MTGFALFAAGFLLGCIMVIVVAAVLVGSEQ